MRLFRYLNTVGAIATIEQRAFRVSRLHDVNDPFEWRVALTGLIEGVEHIEQATAEAIIHDLSSRFGLICFSAVPDEAVLWAHYADRHRGMALEFEVTDDREQLLMVEYTDERPHVPVGHILDRHVTAAYIDKVMRRKSAGWAYEQEYRLHILLANCEARGGHYYHGFKPDALKRVIVGWRCEIDVAYVECALRTGGYSEVQVVRATPKPDSYKLKC